MTTPTTLYAYSYYTGSGSNSQKHWRRSPASIGTVCTFLAANEIEDKVDPEVVLGFLDKYGTYVVARDDNNICEIDEVYDRST